MGILQACFRSGLNSSSARFDRHVSSSAFEFNDGPPRFKSGDEDDVADYIPKVIFAIFLIATALPDETRPNAPLPRLRIVSPP